MAWNQQKYERGYEDADRCIKVHGLLTAVQEHRRIAPPDDVNEYESGFSTRIQESRERQAF